MTVIQGHLEGHTVLTLDEVGRTNLKKESKYSNNYKLQLFFHRE